MEEVSIRPGQISDIPAIHGLVGELAEYEKAPDQFVCSQQEYRRLFQEKVWSSIVAVWSDKIVGAGIYYFGFSTWNGKFLYLEDFVVSKNHRRKGIGQALFDRLIQIARQEKCTLLRWQVLDWNEVAINFYKKYEVRFEENWVNCSMLLNENSSIQSHLQ